MRLKQQDKEPKHTLSHSTKGWLKRNKVIVLRMLTNFPELKLFCTEEGAKTHPSRCTGLINTYWKPAVAVQSLVSKSFPILLYVQ
uniref:Uncharacterized protein n=1 Tax=Seriola dumerili TaxID=41447 RepID=A0A3B4UDK1_SERDU